MNKKSQLHAAAAQRVTIACVIASVIGHTGWAQKLASHTCGDITGSGDDQDGYGESLAAGDLDENGLVDIIVGAPHWDDSGNGLKYGAVYVLWGPITEEQKKSLAFHSTLDADLASQTGQQVGQSLAVIGQFTPDHPRLLLVGAPFADHGSSPPVTDRGRVDMYEYSGGNWAFRAKFRPHESSSSSFFGSDVTSIGDFNRDGYDDFAVGTRNQRVCIFFGNVTLQTTAEIAPDIQIHVNSGVFGRAAYGGDVNGNGKGDLVVADKTYGSNTGRAWVFLDREISGQTPLEWDGDEANFTITGDDEADFLGASIGVGADVTGDGNADLVIAAPASGLNGELLIFEGPLSAPGGSNDYAPSQADGRITGFNGMLAASGESFPGKGLSVSASVLGSVANEILVSQYPTSGLQERLILLEGGGHLLSQTPQSLDDLGDHARRIKEMASQFDNFGDAVLLTTGGPTGIKGRVVAGAPYQADTNDAPGFVHVYELHEKRVAYRQRGGDAYNRGLQYTGAPRSAIVFNYDAQEEEESLFISIEGAHDGRLFRARQPDFTNGIAEFSDLNTLAEFKTLDDLPQANQRGAAAADVEGDGDIDFFVSAPAGTGPDEGARLYLYDQTVGKYEDVADEIEVRGTMQSLKEVAGTGLAASWADYDLDGQVDLLLTRGAGAPFPTPMLLQSHLIEDGDLEDVSSALGLTAGGGIECWAHAWGDFDNDGDPDLFLGQDAESGGTGPLSRLFRNKVPAGAGFSEELVSLSGATSQDDQQLSGDLSAAWADLDRDGLQDLILAKENETSKYAFLRNTGSSFEASKLPIADGGALVIRPSDYDLDGTVDLLTMEHDSSDRFKVLRRIGDCSGVALFTNDAVDAAVDAIEGGSPYILTGDFAGIGAHDGDIDLVLGRDVSQGAVASSFLQSLTLNDGQSLNDISATTIDIGPSKHWIGFVLRGNGGTSGSAIGAKVTIQYDGAEGFIAQTQYVDGGSMRAGQASPVLRFGLDTYSSGSVDAVIKWPTGFIGSYYGVAVDEIHEQWEDSLPVRACSYFLTEFGRSHSSGKQLMPYTARHPVWRSAPYPALDA